MSKMKFSFLPAVIAVIMVSGCASNNAADDRQGGLNTLNAGNGRQGQTNFLNDRSSQQAKGMMESLQEVNDGYITIDPNSYSTGMPSKDFPHGEQQGNGMFRFYTGEERGQEGQQAAPGQNEAGQGAGIDPGAQYGAGQGTGMDPGTQYGAGQGTAPGGQGGAGQPDQGQNAAGEQGQQKAGNTDQSISDMESKVIELTNAERTKNGLSALKADNSLSGVAQEKSDDMQAKNYFSHTSPTYGSPFDMMRDFGVEYSTAGENIAMGQRSAEEVVDAWMKSEGHRKNILSSNFTQIGVGHTGEGNYWTQMFIGK
ncbi:CAP domain-containing protein [Bacillus infantis]|uniref:CAP domain-containing protein n=1 Tax=Bacillus infantis TaxID=324767 RepID=UPI002155C85E|nr:CAP domain-containing protein [Bacillus infantis]